MTRVDPVLLQSLSITTVRPVDANVDISHVATPSEQQWIYLKCHLFRSLYLN